MNIEHMENIYNQLYAFAVGSRFKARLKDAEEKFVQNDDRSDTDGFAEWFIFNYRDPETNEQIINLFDEYNENDADKAIINAIKNSRRSIFEIRTEHEKTAFKDIFTSDDYIIENFVTGEGQLASARLVAFEGKYYLIGDYFELELEYKESIKKYLLDQYNQYTIVQGPTPLDVFFDLNGHLIFKVMGIIQNVSEENALDDGLLLYQATYAFNCGMEDLYDQLMKLEFPVYADEEEEPILRVMDDDIILAEIEITNGMFYVLCNDERHLETMLNMMKPILNEHIVFVKSETFTLEDML